MNEIIKSLLERKSIRSYTDQEISPQCKEQILRAAMEAPTAGNQQMYTILDITRQDLKERLAVTCDNQPFIAKGKMVLIFVFPALMLVFGYPTPQQQEREKPRRAPLDFIVHENTYPRFSSEEIRENIADLKGEDFASWMKRFCKRKYQADFSLEMSRSVAAALKNFQE